MQANRQLAEDRLRTCHAERYPDETPEPVGENPGEGKGVFVVQKHAARTINRLVLHDRYPDGILGRSFFQENAPIFPLPWRDELQNDLYRLQVAVDPVRHRMNELKVDPLCGILRSETDLARVLSVLGKKIFSMV